MQYFSAKIWSVGLKFPGPKFPGPKFWWQGIYICTCTVQGGAKLTIRPIIVLMSMLPAVDSSKPFPSLVWYKKLGIMSSRCVFALIMNSLSFGCGLQAISLILDKEYALLSFGPGLLVIALIWNILLIRGSLFALLYNDTRTIRLNEEIEKRFCIVEVSKYSYSQRKRKWLITQAVNLVPSLNCPYVQQWCVQFLARVQTHLTDHLLHVHCCWNCAALSFSKISICLYTSDMLGNISIKDLTIAD